MRFSFVCVLVGLTCLFLPRREQAKPSQEAIQLSLVSHCKPVLTMVESVDDPSVVLQVTANTLSINGSPVTEGALPSLVSAIYQNRANLNLFILPDQGIAMERLSRLLTPLQPVHLNLVCLTPKSEEQRNPAKWSCQFGKN